MSVRLDTGVVDDDIGFHLLAAVADGTVKDGPATDRDSLLPYLDLVDEHVLAVQLRTESERRRANEDLVARRIDTQAAIYNDRVSSAEETLDKVTREGKDQTLQRLYRGRINNLNQKRTEVVAKLEQGRDLDLKFQPVAVAVMSG